MNRKETEGNSFPNARGFFLRHPAATLFTGLGLLFFLFFLFFFREISGAWEHNTLFRYAPEYWPSFRANRLPLIEYLNIFLFQFARLPLPGALLSGILFAGNAVLLNTLIARTDHRPAFIPGILLSAFLLPSFAFLGHSPALVFLFILAGARVWISFRKCALRLTVQSAVLFLLVFCIREYALIALVSYFLIENRIDRKTLPTGILHFLVLSFALALSAFCLQKSYFPYPLTGEASFFALFRPATAKSVLVPVHALPYPPIAIRLNGGAIACLCIPFLRIFRPPANRKLKTMLQGIFVLTALAAAYTAVKVSRPLEFYFLTDRLQEEGRWKESLERLNREWDKNPSREKGFYTYSLLCAQTKTALLANRKATDLLFTYPRPDFPALFPIDYGYDLQAYAFSPYYYHVGCFSEVLHLNYDQVTGGNISPKTCMNILKASLIMGDSLPAVKFANLLEKALFHKKEADCFWSENCPKLQEEIRNGQKKKPRRNYAVYTYQPDKNMANNYRFNPDNPYYYEYYLCLLLVNKFHRFLPGELPHILSAYRQDGKPRIPRHLQEALLANYDYNPNTSSYGVLFPFIDPETWNDYQLFIQDNLLYMNRRMSFAKLDEKWGKTYWFFDCYLHINIEPPLPANKGI